MKSRSCPVCFTPVVSAKEGRPRRFCSARCRITFWRPSTGRKPGRSRKWASKQAMMSSRYAAARYVIDNGKAGGCIICGESEPRVLDYHHVGPKRFTIGTAAGGGARNLDELRAEIANCMVLCANHHRLYHAGLITLDTPPGGPAIENFFFQF